MFSVIIPLYNKEYSIFRCIDSVLSQTYQNFEIIIINDGSTDDSLSIIMDNFEDEINNNTIKVFNQPNQGVSVARNNGSFNAKSELLCFLDADDEWKPHFLDSMRNLIVDFPKANLYCLEHETKINQQTPYIKQSIFKNGFRGYLPNFFLTSLVSNIANSSKVCVKKIALFEIGAFPEGQIAGEDIFVWMELARTGKVAYENNISARVNVVIDQSRRGRKSSIPYPIIYYSLPDNTKKLTISSKLYLRKVHFAHILASYKKCDYDTALARASAGKNIFPVTYKLSLALNYLRKYKKNTK